MQLVIGQRNHSSIRAVLSGPGQGHAAALCATHFRTLPAMKTEIEPVAGLLDHYRLMQRTICG